MAIYLLIADDHELVRDGLRMAFEGTDVEIVAEAADGQQAVEELGQHQVDVALVDINMPRADGFRFLKFLRDSGSTLPVVMHSVNDGYLRRCRELGAKGFVLKGLETSILVDAIRAVHAGDEYWCCLSGP